MKFVTITKRHRTFIICCKKPNLWDVSTSSHRYRIDIEQRDHNVGDWELKGNGTKYYRITIQDMYY